MLYIPYGGGATCIELLRMYALPTRSWGGWGLFIGPGVPPASVVYVKNCEFSKCEATVFHIREGVILDSVIFEDVLSSDGITIQMPVVLRNVVVRSTLRVERLWVKPVPAGDFSEEQRRLYESWAEEAVLGDGWMLDCSGLNANEVEVVGIPISKLKWNSERHVPILLAWQASKAWKKISADGFWSSRMLYLKRRGGTEGIYTFTTPSSRMYARAIDERELLIEAGLLPVA